MFLGKTRTYVWRQTDRIGKGSTSLVYEGAHSETGAPVAVKVFTQPLLIGREINIMRTLDHENIVKLLAVEHDLDTNLEVIVMELCEGGSLLKVLDSAENTYGLSELEFLTVLEHLCAGMKYLRDNKLIHRDLKPGNIMKYIADDGRIIYKLADFGTTRELEDDEPFATICGTVEYLHPDLYGAVLTQRAKEAGFDTNVDLWSIGATLYQLITGQVPFVACNHEQRGKINTKLYDIIAKKKSGIISGVETCYGGAIKWSDTLPSECQLSEGLKALITPLLAGLLERDKTKAWNFNQFFTAVEGITRKIVIHVFFFNRISLLEVFLQPDELISNIHEHIYQQTTVPTANQILIFNNHLLKRVCSSDATAKTLTATTKENPIFLYDINDNNVQLAVQSELPEFPQYSERMSAQNDAAVTKTAIGYGHLYKRRIDSLTQQDVLLKKAVHNISQVSGTVVRSLYKSCNDFNLFQAAVINYTETRLGSGEKVLDILRKEANIIINSIEQFHQQYSALNYFSEKLLQSIEQHNCPCRIRAAEKANRLLERINVSYLYLREDSGKSVFSSTDWQFHNLEIIKIKRLFADLDALLKQDLIPVMLKITNNLTSDWYKHMQIIHVKANILKSQLRNCYGKFLKLHNLIRLKPMGMSSVLQTLEQQLPEVQSEVEKIAKQLGELLKKDT